MCPECLASPPIFGIWLFWGWPKEVVLRDALPVLCWLCFTLGSGGDPVTGPQPHGGLSSPGFLTNTLDISGELERESPFL